MQGDGYGDNDELTIFTVIGGMRLAAEPIKLACLAGVARSPE